LSTHSQKNFVINVLGSHSVVIVKVCDDESKIDTRIGQLTTWQNKNPGFDTARPANADWYRASIRIGRCIASLLGKREKRNGAWQPFRSGVLAFRFSNAPAHGRVSDASTTGPAMTSPRLLPSWSKPLGQRTGMPVIWPPFRRIASRPSSRDWANDDEWHPGAITGRSVAMGRSGI
jgi:hypothetical protein